MMVELERCPFCGGKADTRVRYWKIGGSELGLVAEVFCEKCGITQSACFEGEKKSFDEYIEAFELAIERWNRRADNGSD